MPKKMKITADVLFMVPSGKGKDVAVDFRLFGLNSPEGISGFRSHVYVTDDRYCGGMARKTIVLDGESKGHLMDGRQVVKNRDGQWEYWAS